MNNQLVQLFFVVLPVLPFVAALVLYASMFRIRSFQGKAMIFVLAAFSVVLGLNAVAGISLVLFGVLADWWVLVSQAAFLLLTVSGVVFCVSIIRARKKKETNGTS